MRRVFAGIAIVAFAATMVVPAIADTKTVKGEIIDVGCYTKKKENTGEGHANCAMSCAKRGAALGILAEDGVYAITGDMTNNKNEKLLEYVAKMVEAKGEVMEKDGQKSIAIASIAIAK